MKRRSLEDTARTIFSPDDEASIQRWVDYWKRSRERNRQLLENFSKLVLIDFRGKRVLDIGCGTGGLGELISSQCALYAGGDYHSHVLQFTRPAHNRHFLRCNATHFPFEDSCFDYIFAFDVIEHLTGGFDWQLRCFSELARVLKPLGMVFFTTPNWWHPYDAHSELYFPHYLPSSLRDGYIGLFNPGFLQEHGSFSRIQLLTPRRLRRAIADSRFELLHDLPCGLDRRQYLRLFPWRTPLLYAGLGWYPHAEFWGILVHRGMKESQRLKLKHSWYYEKHQPSNGDMGDFSSVLNFRQGLFNHQLGRGWYWREESESGDKFRWISREAVCYLQTRTSPRIIRLSGFTHRSNHLEVWVEGTRIGEHFFDSPLNFTLEYFLPFNDLGERMVEVRLRVPTAERPPQSSDQRELGVIIFSVELLP
ncbi:MAG: class I SAM-dependent methyltransferase [Acidobacteria bacterium]|nr:class I SAM-dependent methyltransferase [Acidobacteriota bacterium]